uniref:DNA-directed DNA polymerase family A palm domain-containing protein n=1 Tax=Physcomitrium patens TaxID=3218 RepID=A0A2K1K896_PHYPA|nr:hypothetical protein PHYPA_011894 [Physcomitrium patens]
MEQRQAIQVYRVAVTSGLANPCFISPSFMPPSMQAFSPIQCSSSPILSLHIRSPSKLVGSPICPGRAHSFSCSRDTICTKYSRSTGRSCFFGPRVRLVNGRRFSVWGRDGDIRDVNIVAGVCKSGKESSGFESNSGGTENSFESTTRGKRLSKVPRAPNWSNELAKLSPNQLREAIRWASLDEKVYDAVMLVKSLPPNERDRRRRELNFIGGLLRDADPELMEQVLTACKIGDFTGLANNKFSLPYSRSHYLISSHADVQFSRAWRSPVTEEFVSRPNSNPYTARVGTLSAMRLSSVISAQYTKDQVQLPSTINTALQIRHFRTGTSLQAQHNTSVQFTSTPTNFVPPVLRTVKVALKAVSKTELHSTNGSAPPQYARRVGKIHAQSQGSPLLASKPTPDVGVGAFGESSKAVDSGLGEAWERAAQKLGILVLAKPASASGLKTGASFPEVEFVKGYSSSFTAVDTDDNSNSTHETKLEVFDSAVVRERQNVSEPLKSIEYEPKVMSEPPNSAEQVIEENQLRRRADRILGCKVEKARSTLKKASADGISGERKPKTKGRKKLVPVQLEQKDLVEVNVRDDVPVPAMPSEESPSTEQPEERQTFSNDLVMVVDSVEKASMVVEHLMSKYKDVVHACDTEVTEIDVKNESPVGHGRITCFSIYCGPTADFGDGKNRLWIDVLDGGEDVLKVFKRYFESPSIKKVWHNYSFDKHVLGRHGIHPQGFHADTIHLARLYDSARRGAKGGYSLEVLSADEKVMDGYIRHSTEVDESVLAGKKSMKELFGKANLKKDGTPGKIKTIPPVHELQRDEELRDAWIYYSTFDAVCTWRLFLSLQQKLSSTPWNVADLKKKGSMYDFYEKYWRPFGEVLVQMEADGMLVDCNHLATVEKVAKAQQEISVSRFRKWAAKYCADAAQMNVGSDAQIRQFLYGGTANRKDKDQVLPMERVFSVPNTDGFIEEGKKVAKKTKPIVISGLANFGIKLPVETYTSSGWPAVGGAAIKVLAGKVAIDYSALEADSEEGVLVDIEESEGLLTSAGVEAELEEDLSVYGKAYKAFGEGRVGKEACMALAALCEVAAINTLLSNFIEPLQGNDIKSASDSRVHCSLNINTETGRLSARRPSLQNQPALEKDRYRIRQAFVAAPGKSLVVADYGQHSKLVVIYMYPHVREAVEKERVLLEWEGQGEPPAPLLKDVFGSERRKAKMLNFSIAYGKTAMGLAKDWKVNLADAKATVDLWYSDRPEVLAWQMERKREAHETLCVHTLLGRARHLPNVNSSNSLVRSHMERAAINTPVQGSAADVAMCAMLEIQRNAKLHELGWKLLLQVHDEVILEGPSESAKEAKELVIQSMMYPFEGENFLDVELAVDGKYAESWYAAK